MFSITAELICTRFVVRSNGIINIVQFTFLPVTYTIFA